MAPALAGAARAAESRGPGAGVRVLRLAVLRPLSASVAVRLVERGRAMSLLAVLPRATSPPTSTCSLLSLVQFKCVSAVAVTQVRSCWWLWKGDYTRQEERLSQLCDTVQPGQVPWSL